MISPKKYYLKEAQCISVGSGQYWRHVIGIIVVFVTLLALSSLRS